MDIFQLTWFVVVQVAVQVVDAGLVVQSKLLGDKSPWLLYFSCAAISGITALLGFRII